MSQAVPLVDGNSNLWWPPVISATGHRERVALYGVYGNDESTFALGHPAREHFELGKREGDKIRPLCTNGQPPNPGCPDGKDPRIILVGFGFSNCAIAMCGGSSDIWDPERPPLPRLQGQPCATVCPNPSDLLIPAYNPWNDANDGITQQSFLYQVYGGPGAPLVGPHVVIFSGARGGETLDRWDPNGYYVTNDCEQLNQGPNPECNYQRVIQALYAHGFDPRQVH